MTFSSITPIGVGFSFSFLFYSPAMTALQELGDAFSQASAAAAAESQPAINKPPSPHLTPPPHPAPAAPTAAFQSLPALPSTGQAQPQSLSQSQTLAPSQTHASAPTQSQAQSQPESQSASHLLAIAGLQQQALTQPAVVSSHAQPALQSSVLPSGQRALPGSAPGPTRPLSSPLPGGQYSNCSVCMSYTTDGDVLITYRRQCYRNTWFRVVKTHGFASSAAHRKLYTHHAAVVTAPLMALQVSTHAMLYLAQLVLLHSSAQHNCQLLPGFHMHVLALS